MMWLEMTVHEDGEGGGERRGAREEVRRKDDMQEGRKKSLAEKKIDKGESRRWNAKRCKGRFNTF